MSNPRPFLLFGAVGGFFAVALGAFAAHGLKSALTPGLLEIFQTGVHYQSVHSLALLLTGLLLPKYDCRALRVAGWSFVVGILIFSGSLYLLALTDTRWLGAIPPFGGTALLFGWASLAWAMWRR